jgi:mycofactocin precursor
MANPAATTDAAEAVEPQVDVEAIDVEGAAVVEELLVEEVSIDGMCGVY